MPSAIMAQVARDGSRRYTPFPDGDFREFAWMTRENAREYFGTEYATELMLSRNQGVRGIKDNGIENKEYLVLVRVLPGILVHDPSCQEPDAKPPCQEPDVKPPCQEPDAKPPWQEPDAKLPCQEPMVFRFLI